MRVPSVDLGFPVSDDERKTDRADPRDQLIQFGRLAAVGDGDEHIAFGDDAQIAVHSLDGMEKDGRCARAREGGHDLAADEARFADPRDDDAALGLEDRIDGLREILVKIGDQLQDAFGLDLQNFPGLLQGLMPFFFPFIDKLRKCLKGLKY